MSQNDSVHTMKARLWTKPYIMILIANLAVYFSFHMLLPTLPLYISQLKVTPDIIGLVMGSFTITALAARPFIGRILDTKDRKKVYLAGLLIAFAAIYGYSIFPLVLFVLICRLIHGLGWGITTTAIGTILSDLVPQVRLAEGLGYAGVVNVVSMAISPMVGLYVAGHWGFQNLFYISAFLSMLGIVLGTLIPYPMRIAPQGQRLINPQKNVSGFMATAFEKRAYLPAIIAIFTSMAYGSLMTCLTLYAAELNINNIGIFFSVYAVTSIMTRPFIGRLSDQKGYSIAIIPGIIFFSLSLLLLFLAQNIYFFIAAAVLYGLGNCALQPTLQAMAVKKVPQERRGAANSTYYSGIDIGIAIGMVLSGFLAKAAGYSIMYLLFIIPMFLSLIIYILAVKTILANRSQNR
ncbi:MFS transporter [Dehalobacter sp. DCM]|uniref:MFS transporter n=1 Tax=Dehalobacter sp. DCM TaxID=2907827 RepID=UPI0030817D97|nr:MFS transporter [Dehalobacter sp. DCM]